MDGIEARAAIAAEMAAAVAMIAPRRSIQIVEEPAGTPIAARERAVVAIVIAAVVDVGVTHRRTIGPIRGATRKGEHAQSGDRRRKIMVHRDLHRPGARLVGENLRPRTEEPGSPAVALSEIKPAARQGRPRTEVFARGGPFDMVVSTP
jgi:hypothetical protein